MTIYTTSLCVKANALLRLLTVLVLLGAQTVSTPTAEATSAYDAPTVHAHARTHDPAVAELLSEEITDERLDAFMAEDGLTWIAGHGWGDELDAAFPPDPYASTEADKLQDDLDALALLDNPHNQAAASVVVGPALTDSNAVLVSPGVVELLEILNGYKEREADLIASLDVDAHEGEALVEEALKLGLVDYLSADESHADFFCLGVTKRGSDTLNAYHKARYSVLIALA